MRILLVDPEPDSRSAIARWLDELFGHVQIESAASGAEALKALEKGVPDLVLTAHPMPALGGIELASIVKGRPNPSAVVVMTSGCAASFDLQCGAEASTSGWRNVISRRGCSTSCSDASRGPGRKA